MASRLANGLLIVNDTQEISGINTALADTDSELSTSKAIYDYYEASVTPVSLVVGGSWNKPQYPSQPPDIEGLTFTVTYANGNSISTTADLISPSVWGAAAGIQTATFSYTQNGVTLTATKTAGIETIPASIALNGTLGPQFINEAPNQNGVSFTVTYNNGQTATTQNLLASPNLYTALGSQTVTFYYTENNTTVSTTATVNVVRKLQSLSYEGTWGEQREGQAVNRSGITFTATYADGYTAAVTPSVSPATWATNSGIQTATFSYTENGVTISATKTIGMTYNITVAAGTGGTASGSTTYICSNSAQTRPINYSTNSGYIFSSWSISGGSGVSASGSGTTLTINSGCYGDMTVTANFTWYALSITLTNPKSSLAFRSVSGNLYTSSGCTTKVATRTKYTGTTFYYKSNETRPTGNYIYDPYGTSSKSPDTSGPNLNTTKSFWNDGSLTTCLGTSGYCWTSTYDSGSGEDEDYTIYYMVNLSNGGTRENYRKPKTGGMMYSAYSIRASSF